MTKKLTSLLLAVVLVALTLTACGPESADPPVSEKPEDLSSAQTPDASADSASYEGQNLVIWTNLTADAQYEVLNKQFNELGAELGVTVTVEKVSFNEMYGKLATAVSSGDVPDIMHTNFGGTTLGPAIFPTRISGCSPERTERSTDCPTGPCIPPYGTARTCLRRRT